MRGNTYQWCADFFDPNYFVTSPKLDPEGPKSGRGMDVKGGSWASNPWANLIAGRRLFEPEKSTA